MVTIQALFYSALKFLSPFLSALMVLLVFFAILGSILDGFAD